METPSADAQPGHGPGHGDPVIIVSVDDPAQRTPSFDLQAIPVQADPGAERREFLKEGFGPVAFLVPKASRAGDPAASLAMAGEGDQGRK